MNLAVVGTGYVGLVTGACFSDAGNHVICVDVDTNKIDNLKRGIVSIYEPGLVTLVRNNLSKRNLEFTTDVKYAVQNSDIIFIAVGTPTGEDGSADLKYVFEAVRSVGRYMDHSVLVVEKSTVPAGTFVDIRRLLTEELKRRNVNIHFSVLSNPEFLREGSACKDFMEPDRVIVGYENPEDCTVMRKLYSPFLVSDDHFIAMDVKSAELTKYAANAMLAMKISFINEIANICEHLGGDINKIRIGIGADCRIGYSFMEPGCGYGGSCFPKDVKALVEMSKRVGYDPDLLKAVESVNEYQKRLIVKKIINRFGENLTGYKFAVWGLAFKPNTDDMRQAPSITIVNELTSRGALIVAYDPQAMDEAKNYYLCDNNRIIYTDGKYEALNGADALILITEWDEFKNPDFCEIGNRLNRKIIFDGRNQYQAKHLREKGYIYEQIGEHKI